MMIRRLLVGGMAALALSVGVGSAAVAAAQPTDSGTTVSADSAACTALKNKASAAYDLAMAARFAGDTEKERKYLAQYRHYRNLYASRC